MRLLARESVPLVVPLALVLVAACADGEGQGAASSSIETRLAEIGGRTIEYAVRGRGPVTMVMPNSWGLSIEGQHGLLGGLEERLTMVYFNPRGLGRSSAVTEDADYGPEAVRADFLALHDHLGHETVNAVGWSNGATNLLLLAAEHPEVLERAVLIGAVASFGSADLAPLGSQPRWEPLFRAFGTFRSEMFHAADLPIEEQDAKLKRFDVEIWFPLVTADPDASRELLREAFGDARFSWRHTRYTNRVWSSLDIRDRLAGVTTPLLLIAGVHDMLPPDKSREIAGLVGGESRVDLFEASGHFAPLEEPERFRRLVWEFLVS